MGVAPVAGYGEITQANAYEILQKREELDLTTAQTKYAESFLTDEQRDEIYYSENEAKSRGKDAIDLDLDDDGEDDIKAGQEDKGAGGALASVGTAAAVGATIVACCGGMKKLKVLADKNGFCSLAGAIVALVGAALCLTFSFEKMFDNGVDTRRSFSDVEEDTKSKLEEKKDGLTDNMDLMTADMAAYEEDSENYTNATIDATNQKAQLEIDLADAEAFGDTDKAKEIQKQMQELEKSSGDFDDMEEGLNEKRDMISNEYSASGAEAEGMNENATIMKDYLKVGNKLAPLALVNGILLMAAGVLLGIAGALGAIPKASPFDTGAALASGIMWFASAAMMAMAGGKMMANYKTETEFGKKGEDLESPITNLNDMVNQHQQFMDQTTAVYDKEDEKSEGLQEKAAENADDAVTQKTGQKKDPTRQGGLSKYRNKEDEENKTTTGSGSGSSSGSSSTG